MAMARVVARRLAQFSSCGAWSIRRLAAAIPSPRRRSFSGTNDLVRVLQFSPNTSARLLRLRDVPRRAALRSGARGVLLVGVLNLATRWPPSAPTTPLSPRYRGPTNGRPLGPRRRERSKASSAVFNAATDRRPCSFQRPSSPSASSSAESVSFAPPYLARASFNRSCECVNAACSRREIHSRPSPPRARRQRGGVSAL